MTGENSDARRSAPSAERNKQPILDALTPYLGGVTRVLEVASGTGQHTAHFAERHPDITWQPSDPDPESRASAAAWTAALDNVLAPIDLDVAAADGGLADVDLVYCANMIHIAPWAACLGLLQTAGRHLVGGGVLFLYGPFMRDGAHTADSNAQFDASLRARNPNWGIRDLADVSGAAAPLGLTFETAIAMPANNFSVVFRRQE
ncbi:MAG: DUF938 domain-containing protein [Magnetovibrio sp.]|nr:DUF938 domain-containing protein [Magnetovibrio sp.]